jgi:stage V sporulation protein R
MEYERLSKGYHHGLQKIYEMVINNDPCYAYLMTNNGLVDQKLVMAHVYGHCDFFKNNFWFSATNRKMMDEMANHGNRVRRYMDEVGADEVEEFIDACLSLEDQIDIHSPFIRRREERSRYDFNGDKEKEEPEGPPRFRAKNYMDSFINPRAKMEAAAKELEEKRKEPKAFPERPERDLLLFLLEHAPLNAWQADVLSIIRDEAYYFARRARRRS